MRPAVLAGFVLAALPAAGFAQTGAYLAAVADPEAVLRAGPSDKLPETGSLPRGTRVIVDHDEPNGWVAVVAPGQVSWVPQQFVAGVDPTARFPQNAVVHADAEVTLACGKVGLAQPLEIRRVKVPDGTILVVMGQSVKYDGKTWYPVAPPHGDFRYLPKSSVQFDRTVHTGFSVRVNEGTAPAPGATPAGGPVVAIPGPGSPAGSPGKPVVSHPLWTQAEAAERDGRTDDAEKLYFQLARLMNEPGGDHDIANLCYTRIHALREKKRTGGTAATGGSTLPPPAGREDRPSLLPPTKDGGTGKDEPARPVALPPAAPGGSPSGQPDAAPRWTDPGVLTRSALALDGRRTYALESSPGVVRVYVVAAPGVDLEKFVGKRVEVYGTAYQRKDLSRAYVVAAQVEPAR